MITSANWRQRALVQVALSLPGHEPPGWNEGIHQLMGASPAIASPWVDPPPPPTQWNWREQQPLPLGAPGMGRSAPMGAGLDMGGPSYTIARWDEQAYSDWFYGGRRAPTNIYQGGYGLGFGVSGPGHVGIVGGGESSGGVTTGRVAHVPKGWSRDSNGWNPPDNPDGTNNRRRPGAASSAGNWWDAVFSSTASAGGIVGGIVGGIIGFIIGGIPGAIAGAMIGSALGTGIGAAAGPRRYYGENSESRTPDPGR